jgi:hypothetical protein
MNLLPHLLIADEVWRRMSWQKDMRGPMLLGAISPDAYRLVPGLHHRETHYRSHSRPGQRLADFVDRYLHPAFESGSSRDQAFFAGWLSHICADSLWRRRLRIEVPTLWDGVQHARGEERSELQLFYRSNCALADQQLSDLQRLRVGEIMVQLGIAVPIWDVGSLSAADFERWRAQSLLRGIVISPEDDAAPVMIDYDLVVRTMTSAEEEATAVLLWEAKGSGVRIADLPDFTG